MYKERKGEKTHAIELLLTAPNLLLPKSDPKALLAPNGSKAETAAKLLVLEEGKACWPLFDCVNVW